MGPMKPSARGKKHGETQAPAASELSCEVCGQMPEPTKTRLTLANVAVMLPIELAVHAAVVGTHLPYVAKVLVLTLTATVLVIWVAEPSAARVLRRWLHAPALRHRRRLGAAPALWRARTVLKDRPGSLQKLTQSLAGLDTNILSIHVHPVDGGVLDEFVLSAPGELGEAELLKALRDGGGTDPHVWPTTALAMADGQTGALSLAARIAANPAELPLAVAELLRARIEIRPDTGTAARGCEGGHGAGTGRNRAEDPDRLARSHHLCPSRRAVHPGGIRPGAPAGRARRDPRAQPGLTPAWRLSRSGTVTREESRSGSMPACSTVCPRRRLAGRRPLPTADAGQARDSVRVPVHVFGRFFDDGTPCPCQFHGPRHGH